MKGSESVHEKFCGADGGDLLYRRAFMRSADPRGGCDILPCVPVHAGKAVPLRASFKHQGIYLQKAHDKGCGGAGTGRRFRYGSGDEISV